MTGHSFTPVGDIALWRLLYTELENTPVGGIVTYERLAQVLNLHPRNDRDKINKAMIRAKREMLTERNHAVEAVKNEGYRIVQPIEHLRLAQAHQQRATKQLQASARTVRHVDFNGMDPATRHAFEVTGQAIGAVLDMNRRLDTRQKRLEESLKAVTRRQDRAESETSELRERLARLEAAHRNTTT